MAMQVGSDASVRSEINVTPLVDVVLVLLIIFMVIVPLSQMGYDIEIPRESIAAVPSVPSDRQVILSVSEADCAIAAPVDGAGLPPGCRVRINREECPVTELTSRVAAIFAGRRAVDKVLFLAAEEKLNYEAVTRILDLARAGAGDDLAIGIVTEERLALAR